MNLYWAVNYAGLFQIQSYRCGNKKHRADGVFIYRGGYTATVPVVDPVQDVRICFLSKEGMPTVELLQPVDDKSPVNNVLKKNGTAPYHCCYAVDDMEQAIRDLESQKYMIVSMPAPAVAFGGDRVCFLYHRYVGLIELVERQ